MALILQNYYKMFIADDGDAEEYCFDRETREFHKREEGCAAKSSHIYVERLKRAELYEDYLRIKGIFYLLPNTISELNKLYKEDVGYSTSMLYLTGALGLDDDMNNYAYLTTISHAGRWAKKHNIENVKLSYNSFDSRTLKNSHIFPFENPTKEERDRLQTFAEQEIANEAEDERNWISKQTT